MNIKTVTVIENKWVSQEILFFMIFNLIYCMKCFEIRSAKHRVVSLSGYYYEFYKFFIYLVCDYKLVLLNLPLFSFHKKKIHKHLQ